ncbi:hypothetical protein N6L26_08780 [Qipengyuania sp. SS22]|uniref:beta strand repeat-containing protein n=1 Tax=Qipengyuania sp. SS22 TaxID=2979461 RepID=UPI0021E56349|nr:hypothetical protein [Qipengyuania sp. SS22]UYH54155.1 hypothetical protein N6L26_08780 [Qipengyuania sp. SS22]
MARSINHRLPLLLGGAGLAMAAVLAIPSQARADAFNGAPTIVRGTVDIDRSVTDVDTFTITSATAVLDWFPFEDDQGNALTFLPNGATAYFQDGPGQGGFAVLNRILPSTNGDVVVFQGSVISRLQDANGGFSTGGTVAFYSPTGILVGGTAVFDVGQLLLTTLDADLDSFESYAAGGALELTGTQGSTAGISITPGAQITAAGEGSYFVTAAPQISMQGNANINGSTAYIAGEQVNLTYNSGLFDIEIPVGTSVATPIDHRGVTGGPSSLGAGDNHVIYMVARAVNDPITMLLRGNLGFDTAVSAGVDNGDIILSAGYDVFGRDVETGGVDDGAVAESISVTGAANLTSSVFAGATGNFSVTSNAGAIDFEDGLTVEAARAISLTATNGNDLTITGDADLLARGTIATSGDVIGGTIDLIARQDATLKIAGALTADATPVQDNGAATGGEIELSANGGSLSIDGDVILRARALDQTTSGGLGNGNGGSAILAAQNAGVIELGATLSVDTSAFGNGRVGYSATGGSSEIVAQSGGIIDVVGNATLTAIGSGGDADGAVGIIDGGAGTGGLANVEADGGAITFGGTLTLNASGTGGRGASVFGGGPGDTGGLGQGGEALINALDGTIDIAGTTTLQVPGSGGIGGAGGAGIGGVGQIYATGTGAITTADVVGFAIGTGAAGSIAAGGDGSAGRVIILTEGTGDVNVGGDVDFQATASGGDGQAGGDATGGIAGIYATYGSISVDGSAALSANASAGDASIGFGGTGGNALGGTAYIQADGSQTLSASLTIAGDASMNASGVGGDGGEGDGSTIGAGAGGNGTGGTFQGTPGTGGAFALAGRDNATLTVGGSTALSASGFGGTGGTGGTGQVGGAGGAGVGGTTQAGTFSGGGDGSLGNGRAQFDMLTLEASGNGGDGGSGAVALGAGGIAAGGFAGVFANGSQVDAGNISTRADGTGGAGSTGGDGFGGNAGMGIVGGTLNALSVIGSAQGTGGSGTTGNGGAGRAGDVSIDSDSILNVTGDIQYSAIGNGGASETGDGGLAEGGVASITTSDTAILTVGGDVILNSLANGGGGAVGGNATGGTAFLDVLAGTTTISGTTTLDASAFGGGSSDGDGGSGTGGLAYVHSRTGGSLSFGDATLTANGFGGFDATGVQSGGAIGGLVQVLASAEAAIEADFLRLEALGADTAGAFEIIANGGTIGLDQLVARATGASAGDASLIRAAGGAIPITGLAQFELTGDLDIVTANGGLIGGPSIGDPTAAISIDTGGTVTIDGDNDDQIGFGGQDVFILSSELDILAGARIGAEFLNLVVFGNDATTVLGGTGDTGGYTLTQAELERIDASAAYFGASFEGMASDDLLIRDTTIFGSLDDGVASVFIGAGGVARVEGILAYVDAAPTDELSILAQRLEIVTPGGIGIVDSQDNPTGRFSFFGNDFWMADADTIAQLRDDVGFAGRDALLAAAAAGSSDPLGYLRAGDVLLAVGSSLLVRNTGTSQAPAGITVTGGLSIASFENDDQQTPSGGALDVFAYGRQLNGDGSFVTGEDFFALVEFSTDEDLDGLFTTYTDASQFNDCTINTAQCAGVEPPPPDTREEVLEEIDQKAPAAAVTTTAAIATAPVEQSEQDSNVEFGADFPGLLSASLIGKQGAIDDPVASGGDIALYGAGEEAPEQDDETAEDSDEQ